VDARGSRSSLAPLKASDRVSRDGRTSPSPESRSHLVREPVTPSGAVVAACDAVKVEAHSRLTATRPANTGDQLRSPRKPRRRRASSAASPRSPARRTCEAHANRDGCDTAGSARWVNSR